MALSNRAFLASLGQSILALTLSALLLVTGYLMFSPDLAHHKANASRPDSRLWTFRGSDLVARMGDGETTKEKHLAITELEHGIDERALFTRRTNLKAADYPFLEYKITGRHPGEYFYLIWRRQDSPEEVHNSRLYWAGDRATVNHLADNAEWRGKITEVGLDIYGDLRDQPPVVEFLKLSPSHALLMARAIWDEWTVFREWTQKSAHHLRGTPENPILSPTLAAAAWSGIALILLFCFALFRKRSGFAGYLIAVAIPWIALDALWQSNLSKQLDETRYLFAGKTQSEKHLADSESELYQHAQYLKQSVLPEPGARVFLLNNEPRRTYKRLRLQHYLLPHNIFNFDRYPRPESVMAGDYIIVLGEVEGLTFDSSAMALRWGKQSLAVTIRDQQKLGSVYEYTGR